MNTNKYALTIAIALMAAGSVVYAQKGMGDTTGVGSQTIKPKVLSMSGEVLSVDTHPCGKTTGKALLGTHLMVQRADGKELNLHLGPADEVKDIVKDLSPGQAIKFDAFRTKNMPSGHYVAMTLYVGEKVSKLRDDTTFRPFWASKYDKATRSGKGKGLGKKQGHGASQQPCWW